MARKTRRWQDVSKEDLPLEHLATTFELDNHTHKSPNTYRWYTQRLHNERYMDEDVLEGFRVPKAVKQAVEILLEEEIDKLFTAVDPGTAIGSRDYAILWTFMDCGLRCSELTSLKLEGKVISADAMLAPRSLSEGVCGAGGDYLWVVKDNQPTLRSSAKKY